MILSLRQIAAISMLCMLLGATFVWRLEVGTPTEENPETGGGTPTKAPETTTEIIPETEGAGIMVETSHFPLKLTMILNKTTFEVGEPVNMTFYLENIGNETITLVFSSGRDSFNFRVYNETGSLVYDSYTNTGYAQFYVPTKVVPGSYFITNRTWYQKDGLVYKGIGEDPPAYYNKVPAGKYNIAGLFISRTLNLTIETPPITITIATSTETSSNDEVTSETVFNETFKLSILLNKTTYTLGEPVRMTITLTNVREEDVTIVFLTMPNPNPYWFRFVYDENDQIVFGHKRVIMLPALQEITLQPAEFMQRKCTWNQKDTDNEQQVPPGIYYPTAAVGFMYNGEWVLLETRIKICIES